MKDLILETLLPLLDSEATRVDKNAAWLDPQKAPRPYVKSNAKYEHQALADLARTPWLSLVVEAVVGALSVSGCRGSDGSTRGWSRWLQNRMGQRQQALYREAVAYGHAYMSVLPGVGPGGAARAVFRPYSPRDMVCYYRDPASDDFPQFAFARDGVNYVLIDSTHKTTVYVKDNQLVVLDQFEHGMGVCPVVRYTDQMDLQGNITGQIEPNIPLAARINKTTFDRLLTQHFNSWKVKWASGLETPTDAAEEREFKLAIGQSDILTSDSPDAKFGTLPETPLDGFISATDEDIRTLAAVTSTPLFALTGAVSNLSAEAITASRAPFIAKVENRKVSFGASHAQALRLAAFIEGDDEGAADFEATVDWENREVQSLAAIADAAVKLNPLGVPSEALFTLLPGVTDSEAARWAEKAAVAAEDPTTSDAADLRERFDALGVAIRAGVDPHSAAEVLGLPQMEFTGAIPVSLRPPAEDAAKLEEM